MADTSQALARRSGAGISISAQNLDPIQVGQVLAQSGFFQDSKDAAQAAVKVMAGAELGIGPVSAMTGIYIVKGRVTLSANLMAAAIKRHPHYTYRVTEHTSQKCVISFVEDGEIIGVSEFTMEDAQVAGLTGSQTWKQHPKNMLFARALSNGAKWYCPDAFGGGPVYTPDELGAEVDGETGDVVSVAAVASASPAAQSPDLKPEPDIEPLSDSTLNDLMAAISATGCANEALRTQMVMLGAPDVPAVMIRDSDAAVNRAPLRKLSEKQAEDLLAWLSGENDAAGAGA